MTRAPARRRRSSADDAPLRPRAAASTPPSSPRSRSASSRSSRRACCRSSPATCRRSPASRSPRCSEGERGTARVLLPAIVFCLSFTAVFVALGMTATGLGTTLQRLARHARQGRRRRDHRARHVLPADAVRAQLNQEWRPDALISPRRLGRPAGRRRRLRLRLDAVRRPDARLDPHRRRRSQDTVGKGAILLPSTRSAWPSRSCSPPSPSPRMTTAFRWLRDHYLSSPRVSGVDPDRDGRAAVHRRAHALNQKAQDRLDSLGLNFFYNL